MTDFFETRVENLKPKEAKNKSSGASKKSEDMKSTKKCKRVDSDSSVLESSKQSVVEHRQVRNPASYMENAVILRIK